MELERAHLRRAISGNKTIKTVRLNYTERELEESKISYLQKVKENCEKTMPKNMISVAELADILCVSTQIIYRRIKKLKVKKYLDTSSDTNRMVVKVTMKDAEQFIKDFYKSKGV